MLDVSSIEEDKTGHAIARAIGDLISCMSYDHVHFRNLPVPITSFEGILDETVEPGIMPLWSTFTSASFCNVPIAGGHDFLLSNHQEVIPCRLSVSSYPFPPMPPLKRYDAA